LVPKEHIQKRRKVEGKLPEILDVSVGQFINTKGLYMLHAAPTTGVEPNLVYIRQPVVDILQLLDDKKEAAGFWLKGAPGTGKSQVGRLWVTQQARQGKAVVYGEVRDVGYWVTEAAVRVRRFLLVQRALEKCVQCKEHCRSI